MRGLPGNAAQRQGARRAPGKRPAGGPAPRGPAGLADHCGPFQRHGGDGAGAGSAELALRGRAAEIARDILPEIAGRLQFLRKVGLGYLQLGRGATTLSGGEAQRIRLAAQLGSNLSGVLYILDEPTIGLHAADNQKLLAALALLKARGNSLLVVEHDEETMRRADYIIDLGPGAGVNGGGVVACGPLRELMKHKDSVTARCLRARKSYPAGGRRRPVDARTPRLRLRGARANNLKNLAVAFPLRRFICLTGVSGSGKSTLLRDCLLPALRRKLRTRNLPAAKSAPGLAVSGAGAVRAVYEVDQSPIGRTAAVGAGDLRGFLRRNPAVVRPNAGSAPARLFGRPVFLQQPARPVSGVPRGGPDQTGDEFHAAGFCPVRNLPGHALQPGNAGGAVAGPQHRAKRST